MTDFYSSSSCSCQGHVWWSHSYFIALLSNVSFLFSDCLGSKVFSVIKSDISGNITVRYREICVVWFFKMWAGAHWCSFYFIKPKICSFFSVFQKIKGVYMKDPAKYVTLEDIVVSEREAYPAEWPKVGATLALMWLKRWTLPELDVISYYMLNFHTPDSLRLSFFLNTWSLLQGAAFHTDPAAEFGRRRQRWEQSQPNSG